VYAVSCTLIGVVMCGAGLASVLDLWSRGDFQPGIFFCYLVLLGAFFVIPRRVFVTVDSHGITWRLIATRHARWDEIDRVERRHGRTRLVLTDRKPLLPRLDALRSGTTPLTTTLLESAIDNHGLPAPAGSGPRQSSVGVVRTRT
jgi:hypothetical protein